MTFSKNQQIATLNTGRVISTSFGRLSIDATGLLADGYDGICSEAYAETSDNDPTLRCVLTPAERREIADAMIARWDAWANEEGK